MPAPVSHTEFRAVRASVEQLFDVVVDEGVLPKVLRRYRLVPAVTGTEDVTGPWHVPGSRRTVRLGDGTAVREQVTEWRRPVRFGYRVDGFTGAIARLAAFAVGTWDFDGDDAASTFRWTYAFQPRHALARPGLQILVATQWSGYMRQCADACAELASRGLD
jgi:Polyketide cyclase / dehydrase and lipid transport